MFMPVDRVASRMLDHKERRSRIRWSSSQVYKSSWVSNRMYQ